MFFKILGTLTLQAFLNEFKNSFTTALLQRGPFQNVRCQVAAHSSCSYSGSPVLEGFKAMFVSEASAKPAEHSFAFSRPRNKLLYLLVSAKTVIKKTIPR